MQDCIYLKCLKLFLYFGNWILNAIGKIWELLVCYILIANAIFLMAYFVIDM